MGSLVKLLDTNKVTTLYRVCSAFYPQVYRSLSEVFPTNEKKRPPPAFASFFREKQASVKEDNPELKQKELMKLVSKLWRNENTFTKQQFKNEYGRKMAEYKMEMKVPKRPVPPYLKFFKENYLSLQSRYPELKDRAREAGRMWNALSEYEKEKYRSQYSKDMSEYNESLTQHDKEVLRHRRETLQKHRVQKELRQFGKEGIKERPKPPANNAFSMYVSVHSSEVPKDQNVFQYLGEKWKNLDKSNKLFYEQKLNEVTSTYAQNLKEWKVKYDKLS